MRLFLGLLMVKACSTYCSVEISHEKKSSSLSLIKD